MTTLRKLFHCLTVLIIGFAAGCGDDEPGNPGSEAGKEVIVGIAQEPDSLDPMFGEMLAGIEIRGAIFRSLLMRDDSLKLRPVMAEEIPTLENGGIELLPEGGMKTTWKLKKGFKWEDGVPVTAEDFIFAHKAIMTQGMPVITRDVSTVGSDGWKRRTLTPWSCTGRNAFIARMKTSITPCRNTSSNPS